MKLCSAEAQLILYKGGKLRKAHWRKDTWMILSGVWFWKNVGPFGHMQKEHLTNKGVEYDLYSLSYNSIFVDEWFIAELEGNAGFGLEF